MVDIASIATQTRYFRGMTSTPPPGSRRARRQQGSTGEIEVATAETGDIPILLDGPLAPEATALPTVPRDGLAVPSIVPVIVEEPHIEALTWVSPAQVAARTRGRELTIGSAPVTEAPVGDVDLIAAPRRRRRRPKVAVIAPIVTAVAAVAAYVIAALVWPLSAIPPTVTPATLTGAAAPAAAVPWPAVGAGAVGVQGIGSGLASTSTPQEIASISKVVTSLMILEKSPVSSSDQGPSYTFTSADRRTYQSYLASGESALAVPVGSSLTQYQLLQGILIGSAGNYVAKLASQYWPSNDAFATAATAFLTAHSISGITLKEPTGINPANTATPSALIQLGELAMANPTIADIVRQTSVTLPGAGVVENTNDLLADAGVVGIKTGSLSAYSLLVAKDVTIDGVTVRLYAAALEQTSHANRDAAARALLTELQADVVASPALTSGTTVATVTTVWGATTSLVTSGDLSVLGWNGSIPSVAAQFDLGAARDAGDTVGTVTANGPLNTSTAKVTLSAPLVDPSPWWRLTHPLQLLGAR